MWQMLVVTAMAVFGAFGSVFGGYVQPIHDADTTKTANYAEFDGFAQQRNETSGTRSMIGQETQDTQEATQAEETERELIDVSRHAQTQTATQDGRGGGNVSVLVDN